MWRKREKSCEKRWSTCILILECVLVLTGCGTYIADENETVCASVEDGELTLTLGMTVEDFYDYYGEEEIPSESTPTQLIGTDVIDGVYYKWYFHNFDDISVSTTNYHVADKNLSDDDYVLCGIKLWTSRFHTSKGIKVGDTLAEVIEAYGDDLQESNDEGTYYVVDGGITTSFYIEKDCVTSIYIREDEHSN
ncbi:MAG: hypothetical protein ACI4AA_00655 [Lachnospiraceae bacterium]